MYTLKSIKKKAGNIDDKGSKWCPEIMLNKDKTKCLGWEWVTWMCPQNPK